MKIKKNLSLIAATVLLLGSLAVGMPAQAADAGVKAGILTCNVASGWGFVFASTRDLNCVYSPKAGKGYDFVGHVSKFGVDIGYINAGILVWAVLAPTLDIDPASLAGDYVGVTAGATVGVGADANVLVGGSSKTFSLQPLSIEGNSGLNVAAGIAAINLKYQPAK